MYYNNSYVTQPRAVLLGVAVISVFAFTSALITVIHQSVLEIKKRASLIPVYSKKARQAHFTSEADVIVVYKIQETLWEEVTRFQLKEKSAITTTFTTCLLYTSPSPRD